MDRVKSFYETEAHGNGKCFGRNKIETEIHDTLAHGIGIGDGEGYRSRRRQWEIRPWQPVPVASTSISRIMSTFLLTTITPPSIRQLIVITIMILDNRTPHNMF